MLLIYLSCAWLIGIFLGTKFYLPLTAMLTGLIPFLLLFFTRQHRKALILAGLSLITFSTAATYAHASLNTSDESTLSYYNNSRVTEIRGMVAGDPDVREKSTHLILQATEIKVAEQWQAVKGKALLFVPRYPAYQYGDMLQVTGRPETPTQFNDFDYKGYLAHQGIYTTLLYPEIDILERSKGFILLQWIYTARNSISRTLSMVLPEPQAALAQGIILGIRGNIPSSTMTTFARTGTAHLLAISGLHLGIIAGIMLATGIWLFGRRYRLYIWLALVIIWLYALFTGMHPPVVRGAIMASVFLAAEIAGRQRSAFVALTFAAAIMVGISPYILGAASFQLSFLAMSGLIFLYPAFRTLGRKIIRATPGKEGRLSSIAGLTVDGFSASLAAIVAVWPVIAYYFGIISLVGPVATFLALPALPGIIVTGVMTGVMGFISLPIAQVFSWLTWLFLSYMLWLVNGLAASPLSFIKVDSISLTVIWVYYLLLATAIFLNRKKPPAIADEVTTKFKLRLRHSLTFTLRRHRKWVIALMLPAAAIVSFSAAAMPDNNVHVSFLDVGQGDATLIQKGNQQILIDGGPSPQMISLELSRKMPFWDRTIDLIVLTHPDYDHLAGLVEVIRRYQVKHVLYPDLDFESPIFNEFLKLIEEKNIHLTTAQAGQQITLDDGLMLNVLNPLLPPRAGTGEDSDNNGIVLQLSTGNLSFLLTGDIRQEAEFRLIASGTNLRSTVLKIAHHGSDTSSTPEFLAAVNPQIVVISVGADNKYGLPDNEVLDRLRKKPGAGNIYRTDRQGTIDFITDGERLWVETADGSN
ncbi:MAG: DNA internalization-related competence protein ComEC/Rec2 [Chloroflexi bacterium]|nr:DNA internalization-related competence protein ComEC/Rec2 [Chloroflexota bacterium]